MESRRFFREILPLAALVSLAVSLIDSAVFAQGPNPLETVSASSSATTPPPGRATLPACPPLVDGTYQGTRPDGTVWQPGVNCTVAGSASGPGAAPMPGSDNRPATGNPTNTLDPNAPRAPRPAAAQLPNPFAGSSASSQTASTGGAQVPGQVAGPGAWLNGILSSSQGSAQPGPTPPGQVPQQPGLNPGSSQQAIADGPPPAVEQAAEQTADAFKGVRGRLGVAYTSWPDYLGANVGAQRGRLLVDLTFGQKGFLNNDDGLGWRVLSVGALESKISLNWNGAQVFRGATEGLEEVGNHLSLEVDLVYSTFDFDYELEFVRPLAGLNGWTLAGSVGTDGQLGALGRWDARLGVTYASARWMDSYYGISLSEAAASGLEPYAPEGGFRDIFLDLGADIPLGLSWGIDLGAGVRRMIGPAADAPQVKDVGDPMDYTGHIGLYYHF